jgi:hypothetical protein
LSFCSTSVKRQRRYLRLAQLVPDDSCPNLRTITVDDDNSRSVFNKSRYLSRGGSYVFILFVKRSLLVMLKDCVPAEGKNCYWSLTQQVGSLLLRMRGECWVPFVPNVPALRPCRVVDPCLFELDLISSRRTLARLKGSRDV